MTDDLKTYLLAKLKELDKLKEDPGRNGVVKLGAIKLQIDIMKAIGGADDFDKLPLAEQAKMLRDAADELERGKEQLQ